MTRMLASAARGRSVPSGPRCAAGGATARPRTCRTGTRGRASAPQRETVRSGPPPAPNLDTAELMVVEVVGVVEVEEVAGLRGVVVEAELEVAAAILGVPVLVEEEVEAVVVEEQQEVEVEPLQEEVVEVVRVEARASVEGTPTVPLRLPTAPSGATAGPRLGTPVIVYQPALITMLQVRQWRGRPPRGPGRGEVRGEGGLPGLGAALLRVRLLQGDRGVRLQRPGLGRGDQLVHF